MSTRTAGVSRLSRDPGRATPGLTALCLGLGLLAVAVILGLVTLRGAAFPSPQVRAATVAEAPDPAHADATIVASPSGEPGTLPLLRALVLRLAILAVLAAAGAGTAVWGLSAWLAFRRKTGGTGGVDDVRSQERGG